MMVQEKPVSIWTMCRHGRRVSRHSTGDRLTRPLVDRVGGFLPAARKGQSLVELALVMPPVMMLLLIAANVGLALQAHDRLAQATQQAVQIFLHHPEPDISCDDTITS